MSYARRIRRNRDRALLRDAVAVGAAARGCTCRPNVRHATTRGIREISIYHDDGCPAADTGSQLAVMRGHNQTSAEFAAAVVDVVKELGR